MERMSSQGEMLSQVELKKFPKSSFDMANHNFLSGKLGKIIPTRIDEVYPGDTIRGHVQAVANFEPLAGPIMASMVMKQESFYVPLIEVWKNAHKFFTAKKGFNTAMPSCSPRDVYNAYLTFVRSTGGESMPMINSIESIMEFVKEMHDAETTTSLDSLFQAVVAQFTYVHTNLKSNGEYYGVLDLVQPVIDYIYSNALEVDNDNVNISRIGIAYRDAKNSLGTDNYLEYFGIFTQAIFDVLKYEYEYFFGPSSLLDYVGWPVMDNWDEYFASYQEYITSTNLNDATEPINDSLLFSNIPLNWLKLRAIYLCWYWNYRDQLLETDAYDVEDDDFLSDTVSKKQMFLLSLLRVRCWYKDTFTTALTNTGTGNFRVPVSGLPFEQGNIDWDYYVNDNENNEILLNSKDYESAFASGATIARCTIGSTEYEVPMNYLTGALSGNSNNSLENSSGLQSLSIDLFDRLRRLQNFTQKELLLGYEVDDVVWAHFMVRMSNMRLRIPELLARGRDEVQINTIVNNTDVPDGQPAGDKTAVAWSQGRTSDINYFAEEWGFFISFLTILPIQSYTGGLDRSYLKLQRFDYMWPEFATLGMDAVYNAELSAPRGVWSKAGLTDETALAIFGYQGRYYDLKSKRDEEHGRLRTDLNYLTFSREWNDALPPKLNYIFVHCWPRLDMFVTDDPSADVIKQIDVYHDVDFMRNLPVPSEYVG